MPDATVPLPAPPAPVTALTPMDCHFYIDAANWPNARDRMLANMTTMCPGMAFEFTVTVTTVPDTAAKVPWRFTFNVRFAVPNRKDAS